MNMAAFRGELNWALTRVRQLGVSAATGTALSSCRMGGALFNQKAKRKR